MFRRITGMAGALAMAGVMIMVVLSPRAAGFFPGMFDFLKRRPPIETGVPPEESGTINATESVAPESVPEIVPIPLVDTLIIEQQVDTLSVE